MATAVGATVGVPEFEPVWLDARELGGSEGIDGWVCWGVPRNS